MQTKLPAPHGPINGVCNRVDMGHLVRMGAHIPSVCVLAATAVNDYIVQRAAGADRAITVGIRRAYLATARCALCTEPHAQHCKGCCTLELRRMAGGALTACVRVAAAPI